MTHYTPCQWPAPAHIKAFYTNRLDGHSQSPFNSFNLGGHVGDQADRVAQNREQLTGELGLAEIRWLNQTHSQTVIDYPQWQSGIEADAIVTKDKQQACAIMTADCLPILLTNRQGSQVAAVHAGWRGLASGIIANTLAHFNPSDTLYAYLCPAISQSAFEVGREVKEQFVNQCADLQAAFIDGHQADKYFADLYAIARLQLTSLGVDQVFGGDRCTFNEPEYFFSYRRENITGRQVSLIWIDF